MSELTKTEVAALRKYFALRFQADALNAERRELAEEHRHFALVLREASGRAEEITRLRLQIVEALEQELEPKVTSMLAVRDSMREHLIKARLFTDKEI